MQRAIESAQRFVGATSPNPPVGAVGLDRDGKLLAVAAHERAGTPHAEAKLIETCRQNGTLPRLHTVLVTLEPCNHHGRTPPCSEALIQAGVKRVVYGAIDPNQRVAGKGAERLRQAGIEVSLEPNPELRAQCERLIAPFSKWVLTGLPWVTVKTAQDAQGSMIPPVGQKTFTQPSSLRLAHELRKRADAILTGSGTVLADRPEFTVRHVPDHPGKKRLLVVLDRRGRTPADWTEQARQRGFEVIVRPELEIESALKTLGSQGVLEVLVEAGPTLTQAILSRSLWDEHVVITSQKGQDDRVHWHYSKSGSRPER